MTPPVCCADCQYFIRDTVGDVTGIGTCSLLDAYKAKIEHEPPPRRSGLLAGALRKLDALDNVLWPKAHRNCQWFVETPNPKWLK